jgi:Tol biopolymer transport system component
MGRRSLRAFLQSLAAVLLAAGVAQSASFPPGLKFRTVSTPRVSLHYHRELEPLARQAVALADQALEAHERRYGVKVGRVHVVLSDIEDDPNGFASPLPYPLVHIRAVAPDGSDDLGNHDGWLRLVLTHELAHIVHLDEAGGLIKAGRKVMGRAPFLFPNAATPTWMVEGLATYEETEATAFGRGRDPDVRMIWRMAALEDRLFKEDRPVRGLDRWPGGLASYVYGEAFLRDLSRRFGDDTLPELARVHARRVIPYADDLTSAKVTGATFHTRWREWRENARAEAEMDLALREARGLTASQAVTARGVRQRGPRFSPDGSWIAYTNRSLDRYRAIHIVKPDGTGDRRLVRRNGGAALNWSPDGKSIVFDEPETHRFFSTRSDLRVLDVATRRVRRLTRGLRARDPDVSPDGRTVVFVRQRGDGSDLAVVGWDGKDVRELVRSTAGEQWSGPAWSPAGDAIAAARWSAGGHLDVVLVDPATGTVTPLTEDRAKDVEPAWTPDGRHVVFRSDRDGASNLYAVRLSDRTLLRVTNVAGGAFDPDLSPDGRQLAFADYRARGYDVHLMPFDPDALAPALPFEDPYPPSPPEPAALDTADRPYRPFPALRPRFWAPFVERSGGEWQWGAATGGADPLLRHAYGLAVRYGVETRRPGVLAFYQYDRWWPTFQVVGDLDNTALSAGGRLEARELTLRGTVPVRRTLRSSQSFSLAWRRSREVERGVLRPAALDLGGLEASWAFGSANQYPYSISPVDGLRFRVAYLKEAPALGSDVDLAKVTVDGRAYVRLFHQRDTLALRLGGGATFGQAAFQRSFAVGGFPEGGLFDVVRTNHSVLRGYVDDAFTGRRFVHGNVEYRIPLGHPQRGYRSFPVFLRHLHTAAFLDAAHAWSSGFRLADVKTGVGVALGADVNLGHGLPVTGTVGIARGLSDRGETRGYFRVGLSF